jgi:hypothetical protein
MPAIAARLGLTESQLMDALKQGQTLQALEQAHGVTAAQMHEAELTAIRAALTTGVQKGQWTQAEADSAYAEISRNIDNIEVKISGLGMAIRVEKGKPGPQEAALESTNNAVAGLFGLNFDALQMQLNGGKTLLELERQHNVTEQQVLAAAQAAAQAALAEGVQKGQWDQAAADQTAAEVRGMLPMYLAKYRHPRGLSEAYDAAQNAVAGLFGLDSQGLADALKNGQTRQSLQQAHAVSDQKLRDTALAAGQAALAAGVQKSQWTQVQADDSALAFGETLDFFLANMGPKNRGADPNK